MKMLAYGNPIVGLTFIGPIEANDPALEAWIDANLNTVDWWYIEAVMPPWTRRVTATINPQAWSGSYAIDVDAPGDTAWDATRWYDRTVEDYQEFLLGEADENGGVALDRDDVFKGDPAAPAWVAGWQGPFDIHLTFSQHFFEGPS